MKAALLAAGLAAGALAAVPTTKICTPDKATCFDMPVLGEGSCCGAYNISSWLAQGGNHIDTSCDYQSQPDIAAAIAASGVARSKLWVTSKLNVENCSTNMTQAFYEQVLNPLQMTYVDLLLLHHAGRVEGDNRSPKPPCFDITLAGTKGSYYQCRMDTVQAFEDLRKAGLVRTWGVSNWQVRDLQQMYDQYGFYPPINQIENHPYWVEREVVSFCNRNGILVEAYAPMGDGTRSGMLSNPMFPPIAQAHGATVGQVVLAWELATGADIVIPRSSNPAHQAENLQLFGATGNVVVQLNETEIAAISSVNPYKKCYNTECQPWC